MLRLTRDLLRSSPLASELIRRRLLSDPLRDFVPTVKQSQFISAVEGGCHQEYYFLASNRAGKTKVGSYVGSNFARYGFPWAKGKPLAGWVVSLDFPMSRDTVQPYYFDNGFGVGAEPFIPAHEIDRFDKQAQTLFLRNGSQIAFKSADSGATKFQGAGKDWVHQDEVLPKLISDEIAIRLKAGSRLIQWITATLLPPEGKTGDVHWLYQHVVKPWKAGDKSRWVTNAGIYDNPHLLREEIERLEERYPPGSATRRIRLDGELLPGISGALVYSTFSLATHTASGLTLDERYPVLWAWDFNVSPMCSLICQRKDGKLYVVRELWMEEGSIPEMCGLFREVVSPQHQVRIYGDATGNARSAHTRKTSYQIIASELASKGYVVRMHVPESNPAVISRIDTMNAAMSSHEGKSSLVVDISCKELISDFEAVVYDTNNGIKKSTQMSDPYRWRTHLTDSLGYLICREMPIVSWRPDSSKAASIRQATYGNQSRGV